MADVKFTYHYHQNVNLFYFRRRAVDLSIVAVLYPPEVRDLSNEKTLRDAILSQSCLALYILRDASEEVIEALSKCIQSACNVPAPMVNGRAPE